MRVSRDGRESQFIGVPLTSAASHFLLASRSSHVYQRTGQEIIKWEIRTPHPASSERGSKSP